MAESNSDIVQCPCGFFGRQDTAGLCSKCYKEHLQRKTAEADGTAPAASSSAKTISQQQITQALAQVSQNQPECSDTASNTVEPTSVSIAPSITSTPPAAAAKEEENVENTRTDTEEGATATAPESSINNGTKRVRESSECDNAPTEDATQATVQKNKKRCFTCNCKLQPAIREIGKCKCDLVFCQLHRLPEQHDCIYDHKEKGRQEARDKMVSPKKHMGTSLKRIDSHDS